ncbi:hypothetical protein EDB82DRAFT_502229 [Fusarium venenatum]|uniref:uncharacterized protein n=1 Tax=Fusarium venenatum TaxID=56646 RepID=UPI001E077A78|nr:hypothetical protein EDB82DRAFT_502229 [Fusarium venenatum]
MELPPSNLMEKSSNFFLQPMINSTSVDSPTAAAIYPILQDVHTLRSLTDAYNIDHFLNNSVPTSDDKILSTMSDLTSNISQALRDIMLRSEPNKPFSRRRSQLSSKAQRGQKIATLTPCSKSDKDSGDIMRCSFCGVTETPCWRGTSSGWLLCNFCSLVKSRRAIRKHLAPTR